METKALSSGFRYSSLPENYVRPESERSRLSDVLEHENVPVIDLESPDRDSLIEQIGDARKSYGFFPAINQGVRFEAVEEVLGVHEFSSDDPSETMRLSTSFNVNKEKVHNWRDYLRLHCYPHQKFYRWCMERRENGIRLQMGPVSEIFSLSGPAYLTFICWHDSHHRRIILASLVNGVYILELDRQNKRQGHQALATSWWSTFHFELKRLLIDDVDNSIFGAIYECIACASDFSAPRYVIAFRGTLMKPDSTLRDFYLDLMCICGKLHHTSRTKIAMEAVEDLVSQVGPYNIWLAGHSLGSEIALLIGKNMAEMGYPIPTYLFNPPFVPVSALIELTGNSKVKDGIRFAKSVNEVVLSLASMGRKQSSDKRNDSISELSAWTPILFVNPADPICSKYIDYFECRKREEAIQRLATPISTESKISGGLGRDLVSLHLLPSAYLTVNNNETPNFRRAHGIGQWWDHSFHGQSELHISGHL